MTIETVSIGVLLAGIAYFAILAGLLVFGGLVEEYPARGE